MADVFPILTGQFNTAQDIPLEVKKVGPWLEVTSARPLAPCWKSRRSEAGWVGFFELLAAVAVIKLQTT